MTECRKIPIFDQGQEGACANWAYIAALHILKPEVDPYKVYDHMKRTRDPKAFNGLTHPRMSKWFIEQGYIKSISRVISPVVAMNIVKRGRPIVASCSVGNFLNARKAPYILTFDGDSNHFFTIVGFDQARYLFKCQNSWGPNWGEGGYFYLSPNDWRKMSTPYQLVI